MVRIPAPEHDLACFWLDFGSSIRRGLYVACDFASPPHGSDRSTGRTPVILAASGLGVLVELVPRRVASLVGRERAEGRDFCGYRGHRCGGPSARSHPRLASIPRMRRSTSSRISRTFSTDFPFGSTSSEECLSRSHSAPDQATLPFAPVMTRVATSRHRSMNIAFMNRANAGCASRFQNGLYRSAHPSRALSVRSTSEMNSMRCAPRVTMNDQNNADAVTRRSRRTRPVFRATASSVFAARTPPRCVRAR